MDNTVLITSATTTVDNDNVNILVSSALVANNWYRIRMTANPAS
jgi:hypothetical protein